MSKESRATRGVAEEVGVAAVTLERWLAQGKVAKPKQIRVGARKFRIWTQSDIERIKKHKAKFFYKGRGRKPRRKRARKRKKLA